LKVCGIDCPYVCGCQGACPGISRGMFFEILAARHMKI
jgi:hypothetical protein